MFRAARERFQTAIPSPAARFVVIQTAVFALVALLCLIGGFRYSIGLSAAGAVMIIFRFLMSPHAKVPSLNDTEPEGGYYGPSRGLIAGAIPLVTGMMLSFVA